MEHRLHHRSCSWSMTTMPGIPFKLGQYIDLRVRRPWGWRFLLFWEGLLIIAGVFALGTYGAAKLHSKFYQAYDHWAFSQALNGEPFSLGRFLGHLVDLPSNQDSPPPAADVGKPGAPRPEPVFREEAPDQRGWSVKRVRAYEKSLVSDSLEPIGRLDIPAIDLSVLVLEGTDELTLNRAVGRIEGTVMPGEPGNLGIAGHRDGFFRGLKDLSKYDRVTLTTLNGIYQYRVDDIQVVKPNDLHVLKRSSYPTLTLVTCYPFHYLGDAPKRFIVKARLDSPDEANPVAAVQTASLVTAAPSGLPQVRASEKPAAEASVRAPARVRPSSRLKATASRTSGLKARKGAMPGSRVSAHTTTARQSFPKRLGRGVVKAVKSPFKLLKPRNRPQS